jgi:hypothetical protein
MINILGVKLAAKPMFFELDIEEPPPVLILAINPQEFNKSLSKKVTQSKNRRSYVYNFAFDELDTMNCSGTAAMCYNENGLTVESRRDTLGFRNLRSLVQIYRNNGRNYVSRPKNDQPLVTGTAGLIKTVGRVIISYDDMIYRGSFDSMNIGETDEKPFNLTFNFQFTISNTVDTRNG